MKIFNNVLSKKECSDLINIHKEYFKKELPIQIKKYHNKTEIISIEGIMLWEKILRKVYAKVIHLAKNYNNKLYVSHSEIVRWPNGSSQAPHYDFDFNPYTSIIYLNDDYEGGQTFIKNKPITPKKGKMVLFTGSKIQHSVGQITKGERYTIAIWWESL